MEETVREGKTRYFTKDGKEVSEKEFKELEAKGEFAKLKGQGSPAVSVAGSKRKEAQSSRLKAESKNGKEG